ncbi:pilus assembly protein TadG-related protein [Streptomyces sp. NPDC047999]|uniref:pilus assembly protein TadG-related protein n=1 Tax=Streptomyces sp. NPDC047999 TaxID=3365497 RepID=UPI0037205785
MLCRTDERGQAAPIYLTMVVGLLFLALAFFAVGQAGATHNEAQSAADAAALGAAQESRDGLRDDLLAGLLDPVFLDDVFNGGFPGADDGCTAAGYFAARNGADVGACRWITDGRWGFTVDVVTQDGMGDSILPGTENARATAVATAVVESRCTFEPAEGEEPPAGEEPLPDESDGPPADDDAEEPEEPSSPGALRCDAEDWVIDPERLDLPEMTDLFRVRLAED